METGLNAGQAPSSIDAAEDDAKKAAYWIRIADLEVQRERIDWDFLWGIHQPSLTPNSNVVPAPVDQPDPDDNNTRTVLINAVAKKRLAVMNTNGEAYFPTWLEWNDFSVLYNYEVQSNSDYPAHWTIRPDRVIMLSNPIQSSGLTCKYEYWRKPLRLRQSNDVSRIPDDFSRIIILRAKILYAEHEDAPEVDVGATADYDIMLGQMLAVHSPMAHWQRMENNDEYLQVETA